MSSTPKYLMTEQMGAQIRDAILNIAYTGNNKVVYGFHIDESESDPAARVTYLRDAVGMAPAAMDYTSGKFNYGSWRDAFFMPRPVMLKSDGSVGHYLNQNNFKQNLDGTTSDVTNTAYDGNAMMQWGANGMIWYKIDAANNNFYIANFQEDSNYHNYSFINANGETMRYFYTPIYNGSLISSKLRSLSGQNLMYSQTGTNEITYAKANNPSGKQMWYTEVFADRILIDILLVLMGRSTDVQSVFGQGWTSGGDVISGGTAKTGTLDDKGLFFGYSDTTHAVKVFGMENYWGLQWRRTAGIINASGTWKTKYTWDKTDGSNVVGYNTDGTNYLAENGSAPTASGSYISAMKLSDKGFCPSTVSGASNTYYCDAMWTDNGKTNYILFGGVSGSGSGCGSFAWHADVAVGYADWHVGAALSCKPLT